MTSKTQISSHGGERSTSSREAFPANASLSLVAGGDATMTVTSGLRCAELLGRFNPAMSWARTLLESSRWLNSRRSVSWRVRPLYSTRQETFARSRIGSQRSESCLTLKRADMPSNHLLFHLWPSGRPTSASGCGSSPAVLPTPMAQDAAKGNHKEYKVTRTGLIRTKTNYMVSLVEVGRLGLLPSPSCPNPAPSLPLVASKTSQLNPLYVEEMMGFPMEWLTAPFLTGSSPIGERRP